MCRNLSLFLQWSVEENRRVQCDVRAKNIISFAITLDEFS